MPLVYLILIVYGGGSYLCHYSRKIHSFFNSPTNLPSIVHTRTIELNNISSLFIDCSLPFKICFQKRVKYEKQPTDLHDKHYSIFLKVILARAAVFIDLAAMLGRGAQNLVIRYANRTVFLNAGARSSCTDTIQSKYIKRCYTTRKRSTFTVWSSLLITIININQAKKNNNCNIYLIWNIS